MVGPEDTDRERLTSSVKDKFSSITCIESFSVTTAANVLSPLKNAKSKNVTR